MEFYKRAPLFLFLVYFLPTCTAQTQPALLHAETFEQEVLAYVPQLKEGLTQDKINYGNRILDEVKSGVKKRAEKFTVADYFNVLSAFLTLNEREENIRLAFQKFKASEGSCEYLLAFKNIVLENEKYDIIQSEFIEAARQCEASQGATEAFDIKDYIQERKLDRALVERMDYVNTLDQKYRTADGLDAEQHRADKENQHSIDSLYTIYKRYIGRSLVGPRYEVTMWAVIQHAGVDYMEKYLPVVHQAYLDKELEAGPLKMLIDRYYGLRYGYQVFGSQTGFDFKLATEAQKAAIVKQYGL
jgi:hypothetical protein